MIYFRLPYALLIIFDFGDHAPAAAHALLTCLAHINSTMNPILYFNLNPAFSESLKQFKTYIGYTTGGTSNIQNTKQFSRKNTSIRQDA